jgi:hypothetical protein
LSEELFIKTVRVALTAGGLDVYIQGYGNEWRKDE